MTDKHWTTRVADWNNPGDQADIRHIREQVFINEQNVPVELEWDELDKTSSHLLVTTRGKQPVATARIHMPDGSPAAHIGRMSVLPGYRRQGIASEMLSMLIELAMENSCESIELNAQTTAIPLYEKHGFRAVGEEFPDAGIPHYKMLYTVNRS